MPRVEAVRSKNDVEQAAAGCLDKSPIARVDGLEEDLLEPVAVIGLSLKFPQDATSPDRFWQMLLDGVSAMTEVPEDRFRWKSFYDKDPNKTGTVWCL